MASCYGEFLEDDYSGDDASFFENKCMEKVESSRINSINNESCVLLKPESLINFSKVTKSEKVTEHSSCLSEINFEISEKDAMDSFMNNENNFIVDNEHGSCLSEINFEISEKDANNFFMNDENDLIVDKVQNRLISEIKINKHNEDALENEKILVLLAKLIDADEEKEKILKENILLKENEEFLKNSLMNLKNIYHEKIEELNIKSQLLETQTNELNKAISRQYKLEQEVTFYKLDAKCKDISFDSVEQDFQKTSNDEQSFKIHNISENGAMSRKLLFTRLILLFKKILKSRMNEEILKEIKEFVKYLQSKQSAELCLLEDYIRSGNNERKETIEDECCRLKELMKNKDSTHAVIIKKCNAEKVLLLKELETMKTNHSTACLLNNQIMDYVSQLTKSIHSTNQKHSTEELVFPHLIQNLHAQKLFGNLCKCFKEKIIFLNQLIQNQQSTVNNNLSKEKEDLRKTIEKMREELDLKESNIRTHAREISLLKLQFSREKNEIEKKHLFLLNEYDNVANSMKQKIEELDEEINNIQSRFENLAKNSEKTIDALDTLWLQIQNGFVSNQLTCSLLSQITKIKNMTRKPFLQIETNKFLCSKYCLIYDEIKNKKSYGSSTSMQSEDFLKNEESEIVKEIHGESPSIDMNNNSVTESQHFSVNNEPGKTQEKRLLLNNFKQSHTKLRCQLSMLESKYSTK